MNVHANYQLSECFVASSLGIGNKETLENYMAGIAPGMKEISGDIPSRSIYFGSVLAQSPEIPEEKWRTRTNGLLQLALDNMPSLKAAVEKYGANRVGIVLGASNTGIDEAEAFVDKWLKEGEKPAALDFSMIELGTPAVFLASRLGVTGPAYTVSTACSSATKALGAARRLIEKGICDAVITGGVDGRCRFAMNGFHALGALSQGKCRPLAEDRDGINLGEGVALFLMESGKGAVNFVGIGESSDAYHATSPDPEGNGAEEAMRLALEDANMAPQEIGYVNLHGTGTQANDSMEVKAVQRVFGSMCATEIESTKNLTGHCLGAAGAVEAALCWILIKERRTHSAMSNSFAFGGSNGSVILSA